MITRFNKASCSPPDRDGTGGRHCADDTQPAYPQGPSNAYWSAITTKDIANNHNESQTTIDGGKRHATRLSPPVSRSRC